MDLRIMMIGFGNVGQNVLRQLAGTSPARLRFSAAPVFTGIFTANHGAVVNPDGLPAVECLEYYKNRNGFTRDFPYFDETPVLDVLDSDIYDVLVEVSTLAIKERGDPAYSYVRRALERGKHAVLANKGPVAYHYRQLRELAEANQVHLLFESTVMDGAPVFSMVRNGMRGCRVTAVSGILNSTTNFVLDGLRSGLSMEEAIRGAQKLGIAEADPGQDLDGWDCAVKLTILANVLMDADLTPESVRRVGFDQIAPDLIREAARSGTCIRQVGTIRILDGKVSAGVSFQAVSGEEIFAHVRGTSSILRIETDCMCPQLILQEDPGLQDTAYGIINDLMILSGSNLDR